MLGYGRMLKVCFFLNSLGCTLIKEDVERGIKRLAHSTGKCVQNYSIPGHKTQEDNWSPAL